MFFGDVPRGCYSFLFLMGFKACDFPAGIVTGTEIKTNIRLAQRRVEDFRRRDMANFMGGMAIGYGVIIAAAGLSIGSGTHALAQSASTDIKGIVWTELEKLPLASDPSKEESIGIAVIQPSAPAERHSHAENEIGYDLEGETLLEVDGQPTRTIKAGDSFAIPAGMIHRAIPSGSVPLKVVVTYIVEKGQPLAQPAD